ncbi:phage tail protein [Paenibacillus sp. Marseille-Q7038]
MPQHTHEAYAGSDGVTANSANATWGTTTDVTPYVAQSDKTMSSEALTAAGNSEAHSNMQPYLVVNYCIATTGIWPSRG